MKPDITGWLRKESLPRNLYELLGHTLFDPNREELLQSLRSTNRELLDYQSHPEPAMANRAMALLTELGRARGILEDPAKLQTHNEELIETLRQEFTRDRGAAALKAGTELSAWLVQHNGLDPADAERVASVVRGAAEPPPPSRLPKPDRSKFGAFAAPPPSNAKPPKPVAVEEVIYNLDDYEVAKTPLPPIPPRQSEPVPRVHRPRSFQPRKKETSLVVPIIIAASVLALSGLIAVVYVATRETSTEKVAENERKQVPAPQPEPPVEEPGRGDPKIEPKPEPKPEPKTPLKTEPKKTPKPVPKPDPQSVPDPQPEPKPVPKPVPKPQPKVNPEDEIGWKKVEDGIGDWKLTDVEARINSIEAKQVVVKGDKNDVLIIWIELRNTGTTERTARKWMDWSNSEDKYFDECKLMNLKSFMPVTKPYWLTHSTKLADLPNWSENLPLPASKKLRLPLIFNPPVMPSKEFMLTLDAIRLTTYEVGRSKEVGTFRLPISEKDWKK